MDAQLAAARIREALKSMPIEEWYRGQFHTDLCSVRKVVPDPYHHQGPVVCDTGYSGDDSKDMDIAAYIAAANPSALRALLAERGELAKDAARYRWLRDSSVPPHNFYLSVPDEFEGVRYTPDEVDAGIDAALAALTNKD